MRTSPLLLILGFRVLAVFVMVIAISFAIWALELVSGAILGSVVGIAQAKIKGKTGKGEQLFPLSTPPYLPDRSG